MKKYLIYFLLIASFGAFAQTNTNTRQLRFFAVTTASDTVPSGNTKDGRMWYDFASDKFRAIVNGAVVDVGSGSGGGGTWGTITGTLSDQTDLQTALDAKVDIYPATNEQTDNYTLVLSDVGKLIEMNTADPDSVTIPTNFSVAFPINTYITIVQYGSFLTSVVGADSVTIRSSSGTYVSPGQYSPMVIKKIGTNEWYLWNGTAPIEPAALTKNDDTNVTLTLGGSPTQSLLQATSLTLGWTGTLAVARGGTGADNTTQTYTPTFTNTTNVSASTPRQCSYFRVGNMVTVSGQLDIDPAAAVLTTLGISLPISSDFTTAYQAGGTAAASGVADSAAAIFSDATNNRVTLQYVCTDTTNHTLTFSFTYQVL